MLDIKLIREETDRVYELLSRRNGDYSYIYDIVNKDKTRREAIQNVEALKAKKNEASKMFGAYKKEGKDPSSIQASVQKYASEIVELDSLVTKLDAEIKDMLLMTPNLPNENIAIGKDDSQNRELYKYLEPTRFSFPIKPHYDLGEKLDILDFNRAAKISASRFVVYKGLGARLERSLIMYMMDLHATEHGYREIMPPYIVNEASMYATGQFPKFKDEAFKLYDDRNLYLNPTAEVPTINLHRDEVLDVNSLPIKYVSYTTAFRQEAGSAGRDVRGILRQHQFNKVELIKFTKPEESYIELDKMLADSESVLQKLAIPYHVVELCTGDLGFAMRKTYDIEVWIPSENKYREIGSISNAEDYQARRANIKFRRSQDAKLEYVHTLNGSGLAVGRTVIAIMENYQQEDGSIIVPTVLQPYMGVAVIR
ncbi:MAG: serine--tRNA ligase [Candidatus Izemoplasmatales bacterium]|jgi:seryl-tRNA synthetase|nr:serine--tRNA ligase [Candidatus Izemoplasmatales bacterium]MDD3865493.1 serine--tRNA ligase [Candidatus Izemoplasmatales bacterium]